MIFRMKHHSALADRPKSSDIGDISLKPAKVIMKYRPSHCGKKMSERTHTPEHSASHHGHSDANSTRKRADYSDASFC